MPYTSLPSQTSLNLEVGAFGIAVVKRQVTVVQIVCGHQNWTYADVTLFTQFGDGSFLEDNFSGSGTGQARISSSDLVAFFPLSERLVHHDHKTGMVELSERALADFTRLRSWNSKAMEDLWQRLPVKSHLLR